MPKLSMNPAARYTTQSASYDRLLVGKPLSDRRIAFYQRQGRYGEQSPAARRAKKEKRKHDTLAKLLKSFG